MSNCEVQLDLLIYEADHAEGSDNVSLSKDARHILGTVSKKMGHLLLLGCAAFGASPLLSKLSDLGT